MLNLIYVLYGIDFFKNTLSKNNIVKNDFSQTIVFTSDVKNEKIIYNYDTKYFNKNKTIESQNMNQIIQFLIKNNKYVEFDAHINKYKFNQCKQNHTIASICLMEKEQSLDQILFFESDKSANKFIKDTIEIKKWQNNVNPQQFFALFEYKHIIWLSNDSNIKKFNNKYKSNFVKVLPQIIKKNK